MKSKVSKAKKITIDDLAVTVGNLSTKVDKLAVTVDNLSTTVDNLAVSVAKGFSNIDEKFIAIDKRFDDMDEKIDYRFDSLSNRLDRFVLDNVTHEEHHLLEVRVSKIEKKFKIA